MDPSQFTSALHQHLCAVTTSQDNKQLQEVSSALKQQFYTNPQCVPSLLQIATAATDIPANVRQLAAVEGRKHVKLHWKKLNIETQKVIKEKILECVINETDNRVQQSLTHMVAAIGQKELRKRAWGQLVDALMNGCQSTEVRHREVSLLIFRELISSIVNSYDESRVIPVLQLISNQLVDKEHPQIRLLALETMGSAACITDRKNKRTTMFLQNLVPQLVEVLTDTLADIESAKRAFEAFDYLLSSECPILNPHLLPFVHLLVGTFSNANIHSEIRVLAGNVIILLPMYKGKGLKKLKLIDPILDHILPMTVEASPDDDSSDTPGYIALKIVHAFSTYLHSQDTFNMLSQKLTTMAQDPNPLTRAAAIRCIGLTVESSSDLILPRLESFVQLLCQQMMDNHPAVRKLTCETLVQFIESLDRDVATYHAHLIPRLLECATDPNSRLMAASALDSLLEIMESEVVTPYLPTLVNCLLALMQDPDVKIRQQGASAIGSAAHSAEDAFRPYFPHVFPAALSLLQLSNQADADEMLLRGIGIDTMSALANAVGPDMFREHVPSVCTLVVESMHMKAPKLKECAFCFFGVLSGTFKREFSPFLSGLIPALFESIDAEEASEFDEKTPDSKPADAAALLRLNSGHEADLGEEDLGSDDDDDDDDDNDDLTNEGDDENEDDDEIGGSMLAEEKATAIDVLGDLFASTQQDFLPYLEESVKHVLAQSSHYNDEVRRNVLIVLCKFIQEFYNLNVDQGNPMPPAHVGQFTCNLMNTVLTMLMEEEEPSVVSDAFDSLQGLARTLKGHLVEQDPTHLERLGQIMLSIFNGTHISQKEFDKDDELDENDEDEDISSSILEQDFCAQVSACDLIAALTHALGTRMVAYITVLLPEIIKSMDSVEENDLSSMVGSLADMCVGLKSGVNACAHLLLPFFQSALAHTDQEIVSNAVFGVGVLFEHCNMVIDESTLIHSLLPLFQSSLPQCVDNVCGALARILYKKQELLLHPQLLPTLLEVLPLREDFQENEPVFKLLQLLLLQHFASCAPFLPRIMQIFAHALLQPEERLNQPELLASTVNVLRSVFNPPQPGVQESLQSLPTELSNALLKVLY